MLLTARAIEDEPFGAALRADQRDSVDRKAMWYLVGCFNADDESPDPSRNPVAPRDVPYAGHANSKNGCVSPIPSLPADGAQ